MGADRRHGEGHAATGEMQVLEVAHLWGDTLLDVRHFSCAQPVSIGEAQGNAFTVFSHQVGERFALAERHPDGVALHLPAEAQLTLLRSDGTRHSRTELEARGILQEGTLTLAPHEEARVSLGTADFRVRSVPPGVRARAAPLPEADYTFFKVITCGVMGLIALVGTVLLSPMMESATGGDVFRTPGPVVALRAMPPPPLTLQRPVSGGAPEGERARGEEGRRGEGTPAQRRHTGGSTPAEKRRQDLEKVHSAGILAAFGGDATRSLLGAPGLGTGISTAMEGLKGASVYGGAGSGLGGMGTRGSGSGGGGQGLGIGGLGTRGGGGGRGGAGLDLEQRAKEVVRVVPGRETVVGGLDKDVIARVIQSRQGEIRHCYERALQGAPDLGGKVAVQWTIEPDGVVKEADVAESTLGHGEVEACILARVRRWRFPEALAGGQTVVTFPWLFKAAGTE